VTAVFLAGTTTDVGKTWWGCATIARLVADGVAVAARKPAQSFMPDERGGTDAELLARASGEDPAMVCPHHRWFEMPMAPPMAAAVLGLPAFTVADLVGELAPAAPRPLTIVEGAGGPRSPIASDGDNVDLAAAIAPALVALVAPAGLGTINAVRLSAAAFAPVLDAGARLVVALNRYDGRDDLHRRNRAWLGDDGFELVASPPELAAVLRGIS
jgi:dethiobiotin synthetase